jgi:hypothetical protein
MPRSTFRRIEIDFLETYVPSWRELKGSAGDKIDKSTRLNARTLHVRKVVKEFLATFQERDPTFSDPSPITFTQEEVNDLGRVSKALLCLFYYYKGLAAYSPMAEQQYAK